MLLTKQVVTYKVTVKLLLILKLKSLTLLHPAVIENNNITVVYFL